MEKEHEQEKNAVWENQFAVWEKQIAALDKTETALVALRASLRNALTTEKNSTQDDRLTDIVEKKLELRLAIYALSNKNWGETVLESGVYKIATLGNVETAIGDLREAMGMACIPRDYALPLLGLQKEVAKRTSEFWAERNAQ